MSEHSIIPPTGEYGLDWPANHVLPQGKGGSISQAGWTEEAQGFPQQTFLGASIRSFNISAGFGDTSSQLSVDLVNDEYNKSDGLPLGQGDDVYHNGLIDTFQPPVVGTPVYFKFGKNFATIDQAYRKTLDGTYNESTIPSVIDFPTVTTNGDITQIPGDNYLLRDTTGTGANAVHTWVDKSSLLDATNNSRGKDHFVFGGILQSYTQTKGPNGNPLYSLNVTDPREILSNATVILNNYQGTTFNNKNLFNVYGFLEYDVSDELKEEIEGTDVLPNLDLNSKNILTKNELTFLPQGTFIINIGRGGIINENDLINFLDSGHIKAAALDVFAQEPLPENNSLWMHPSVYVTPHIAGQSNPRSAAKTIAENIRLIQNGEAPYPIYSLDSGY